MKKYPEIYKTSPSSENAAEITADLLREISDIVRPKYENGEFSTGRTWRICIVDSLAGQNAHYVLDVGESEHAGTRLALSVGQEGSFRNVTIAYCDNHFVNNGDFEITQQDVGSFTVCAAGNFGNYTAQLVTAIVARVYLETLERRLPGHAYLVDPRILDLP